MVNQEGDDLTSTEEFKEAKYAILDNVFAGLCFALFGSIPFYLYAFYRAATGYWWPIEWMLFASTILLWLFFLRLGRILFVITKDVEYKLPAFLKSIPWSIEFSATLFLIFLPMLMQLRNILS